MASLTKQRTATSTWVVALHPLAARYLDTALKRSSTLEVTLFDTHLPTEAILSNRPSILIVDAGTLPFPLAPYLRSTTVAIGDVPVLAVGKRLSDDDMCRLLFYGARGFVAYEDVETEICAAVEALVEGHTWYTQRVLERYALLSSVLSKQQREDPGALSPRESQVVGLLQRNLSNKEIGCALGISERTVRFHLHNVFEKLGVHSRHEAAESVRDMDTAVTVSLERA